MNHYFEDYLWKKGKPVGKTVLSPQHISEAPQSYKIVSDPYYKRISVEKYVYAVFEKIVYDSVFLDFRKLQPNEQTAWSKELFKEDDTHQSSLIRDQYDRLILIETSLFEQGFCRECRISSSHGILVSVHRMYYKVLNDAFNGVVLFDAEGKAVMRKEYDADPHTNEFTDLLKEDWETQSR